jgi:hypothetical protein
MGSRSTPIRIDRMFVTEQERDHQKRIARLSELLYFLSCQRDPGPASTSTASQLPEIQNQEHSR